MKLGRKDDEDREGVADDAIEETQPTRKEDPPLEGTSDCVAMQVTTTSNPADNMNRADSKREGSRTRSARRDNTGEVEDGRRTEEDNITISKFY